MSQLYSGPICLLSFTYAPNIYILHKEQQYQVKKILMNLRFLQKKLFSLPSKLCLVGSGDAVAPLGNTLLQQHQQFFPRVLQCFGRQKTHFAICCPSLLFLTVFFSGTLQFYSIRLSQPVLSILGQSQIISFLFLQKQRIRALALKQQIYLYLIQTELILMGTYRILAQFIWNARVSKIYTFASLLINTTTKY